MATYYEEQFDLNKFLHQDLVILALFNSDDFQLRKKCNWKTNEKFTDIINSSSIDIRINEK
jgi:hypothetical protein